MEKKYTWRDYAGVVVAVVLVAVGIDMVRDAYGLYQEEIVAPSQSEEMLANKSDWIRYTNTDYGYEISYPSFLNHSGSSEFVPRQQSEKKDQLITLKDPSNSRSFNIGAGYLSEFNAKDLEELKQKYKEVIVDIFVNSEAVQNEVSLAPEDFVIVASEHQGRAAIRVRSPIFYSIVTFNDQNEVFEVMARDYTGATTTPKERLTREIMETFTVLD